MNIRPFSVGNVRVIELFGRFDAFEVQTVKDWLDENVTGNSSQLVVGLAGVNFVDSSAIATLVQGMKKCRENGGDLYIAQLDQSVRVIFELTRLDKAFNIFDSVDDAVKAFGE